MKDKRLLNKTILAIIAITFLETLAIFKSIDGAILGIAIATIAGLAGYQAGKIKKP